MSESPVPAEAVRAVSVILRAREVDSSGEGDIAPVAEFDPEALELVEAALAAIEEEGYVIVRAEDIHGVLGPKRGVRAYIEAGRRLLDSAEHPAQPPGTLQDAQSSGDGITGPFSTEKTAASLSAPHGWTEFADVRGRRFLRKIADNGDLLILPAAPITEEKPHG